MKHANLFLINSVDKCFYFSILKINNGLIDNFSI